MITFYPIFNSLILHGVSAIRCVMTPIHCTVMVGDPVKLVVETRKSGTGSFSQGLLVHIQIFNRKVYFR